jgi:nitrite reductase (NADH) small subunit
MGVTTLDLRETAGFLSGGTAYVFLLRDGRPGAIVPSTCPHRGGPLNLGTCEDEAVVCPWHHTRTRVPAVASRRAPFVFVRDGATVTLVGPPVQDRRRVPVLDAHRAPTGAP